jgi:hypothetical protein
MREKVKKGYGRLKELCNTLYSVNFRYDKFLRQKVEKGCSREEILRAIDRAEKVDQMLGGVFLSGLVFEVYQYNLFIKDKIAHALKGYVAAALTRLGYNLYKRRGKSKLRKFVGLIGSALEGMGYELYQYGTHTGHADIQDALSDISGGVFDFLIAHKFEKRREKVYQYFDNPEISN